MKRELIIACLTACLLSSCTGMGQTGRNEQPSSSPRAAEIHKALKQTVIPEIDLENVSLPDAIKAWAAISRDNHKLHFDFRHQLTYPMTFSIKETKQSTSSSPA